MKYPVFTFLAFIFVFSSAFAQENSQPFGTWLDGLKQDARKAGISQATLDDAFADTAPIDRIIELDRKQPEGQLTLAEYMERIVSEQRIEEGKEKLAENRELLEKIGKEYGVQPRFIVALWGIETNYGGNTGGFSTVDALATLAYDGRRSDFFRGELINALKILQQENIPAADLQGSWAGAMGQCQFMPSSFLQYAVDYDRDGKRDIWNNHADAFASIANYLKSSGWNGEEGWGREVSPAAGGSAVPQGKPIERDTSLLLVGEGENAVPYLITGNYKVLLKWNRSRYFATSVGTLADHIE